MTSIVKNSMGSSSHALGVVDEVVEEYLRCGDLHEGFARVRCTNLECKHE